MLYLVVCHEVQDSVVNKLVLGCRLYHTTALTPDLKIIIITTR